MTMLQVVLLLVVFVQNCVVADDNIALGKSVRQSGGSNNYGAQLAVDGNTNQDGPCSKTTTMLNPWWIVDLGAIHKVDVVTIYVDDYCCYRFSRYFKVFAIRSTHLKTISECSEVKKETRSIYSVKCAAIGRYVMVQRLSPFKDVLQICEVQITGVAVGNSHKKGKFCKSTRTKRIERFTTINVRSQLECAIYCYNGHFCTIFSVEPSMYGKLQCFLFEEPGPDNALDTAEEEVVYYEC